MSNELCFDYKTFNGRTVGIPEEYKVLEKGNIRTIKMVVGIDILGRIANPYIYDMSRGFLPSRIAITNTDEANVFCRSHKPLYTLLPDIVAICKGTIKVDISTGLVIPNESNLDFCVPKTHNDSKIVCTRLTGSATGGEQFPIDQLNKLESGVYKQLSAINTESRLSFLCSRLLDERR